VVVGHDAGPVAAVVGRFGRGRIRVVYADRWADGNGASLATVQGELQGQALFVLVTADHVFGEGGLERLLAAGEPAVLIDPAPDQPTWAEGTRVRVVNQAVVAFGKHLEEPAIDCGAFLLPPEVFDRQHQAATEGDHSLAGAVTRLAQTRPLRAVDLPAGCWWQDVDTPGRAGGEDGVAALARQGRRRAGQPPAQPAPVDPAVDGPGPAATGARPGVAGGVRPRPGRGSAAGGRSGPGRWAAGPRELSR
jgi:choline kinase